jgi:hypothetical protein
MAAINLIDRKYIEETLQMESGNVLDIKNQGFQQIVYQQLRFDVYERYEYESKAKLLRRIMADESNYQVGRLLLELLRYRKEHIPFSNSEEKTSFNKSLEIAYRLVGRVGMTVKHPSKQTQEHDRKFDFSQSISRLNEMFVINNPQRRGYAFEKFLFWLFEENDLSPRSSFKIVGEQIDGSFEYANEIYLLEAKWTQDETSKSDLVIFNEKVSSKSGFTRGVYVSYAGYANNAINTFNNGRVVRIVLISVQELVISFERGLVFTELLRRKIRALAEEGVCFKSVMEI